MHLTVVVGDNLRHYFRRSLGRVRLVPTFGGSPQVTCFQAQESILAKGLFASLGIV